MKRWEKNLLYVLVAINTVLFLSIIYIFDIMPFVMGFFFIIVAILKLLDWDGFIMAFKEYDLLAQNIPGYATVYPLIELALGLGFLFTAQYLLTFIAGITLVIAGISAISVLVSLAKNQNLRCACLGTLLNIPLTEFTLWEDIIMVAMAVMMLL